MEYGVIQATSADGWKAGKRAEELGFDSIWFEDSQMVVADPFMAMATTAMETKKIRLGTGVCIPSNRIPPSTANMLATVNQLAPGRVNWGVGTGFSGRRAMGMPAIKIKDFDAYIGAVQGLLDRETVDWEFEGQERKIKFLNPERDLFNTTDPVHFHIAAMGPRGRELTARRNSNWIHLYSTAELAASDMQEMNSAYAEAGRNPDDFKKTAFLLGGVIHDDETADSPRVRAQAGPMAAVVLHNLMETQYGDLGTGGVGDNQLMAAYHDLYDSYQPDDARYLSLHRGHCLFLRDDEEPLLSGDFIKNASFTGTVDELADKVKALRDAGYTEATFLILPHHPDMLDDWARVMDKVG
jgi:5,10-methylenetetrahydromethanopterin reductase